MNIKASNLLATLTAFLLCASPENAWSDRVLCLRNTVKSTDSVNLKKAIKIRSSGTCRKSETRIDTILSAASLLSSLLAVDGTGSSLDADTLDGEHASTFATAAGLASATADIASLQEDSSAHAVSISSLESDSSQHESDISSLQSASSSTNAAVEDLGLGATLVRVGLSGSQYSDLASAISYVTAQSRSSTNRYVILLGPGEFTLSAALTIPSYTELRGSGRDATIIQGQNGIDVSSLIVLSDDTSISQMTVRHSQTEALGSTAVIDANGTRDADITNPTSFPVAIRDVRIEMSSANPNVSQGIRVDDADTLVERTEISISGGSSNYGISSTSGDGDLLILDSKIQASDSNSYAILYQQSGQVRVSNSILNATGTAVSIVTGTAIFRSSLFTSASTCARAVSSAVFRIANSMLECPTPTLELSSGNVYCANSTDETLTALNADCG